jgi:hypothetical protein
MRVERLVLMSSLALFTVAAAAVAQSVGATTMRAGDADGANTVFIFGERPKAIVLRTARVGVAGSRLEVTVDQVKKPVFDHVFAAAECKFGDGGSACEVIIPANDPAYRAILTRFKRGRLARVTIRDAGVMKMDQTISLSGFANALR